MTLMETLVLAENSDLLQEVLANFPVDHEHIMGVEVYRLQFDENLVMHIYGFTPDSKISQSLYSRILVGLTGVVVLAGSDFDRFWNETKEIVYKLESHDATIPLVVAIKAGTVQYQSMEPKLKEAGLLLTDYSRLCFWTPDDSASIRNIWQVLWLELPETVKEA